jgi:hypothetical protein
MTVGRSSRSVWVNDVCVNATGMLHESCTFLWAKTLAEVSLTWLAGHIRAQVSLLLRHHSSNVRRNATGVEIVPMCPRFGVN